MPGTAELIARRGDEYDPRVRGRIERAAGMTAVELIELRDARADLIARLAPLHRRVRRAADADRGDHRAADRGLRARRAITAGSTR